MNFKKQFILIYMLSFYTTVNTYITSFFKLTNEEQTIYLLGDTHLDDNLEDKIISEQVNNTIQAAQKLNASVIVEDSFNGILDESILKKYDDLQEILEESSLLPSNYLGLIYNNCKKEKLSITNIEFRYALDIFLTSINRPFSIVLDELEEIKTEIENYSDENKGLQKFYKRTIDKLNNNINIKFIKKNSLYKFNELFKKYHGPKDDSISENEKALSETFRRNLVNQFTSLPSGIYDKIIEARVLHNLYLQRNKKNIFICLGRYHCKVLSQFLEKSLNFKITKSKKTTDKKVLDLEKLFERDLKKLLLQN